MPVVSVGTMLGQVLRKIGNPTIVTDQELLQRYVQQRSEAAFEELMYRHGAMVWGVCQRMLTHKQDAEDAFQATFIVLSKKAGTVRRPEQLAHWLYGVACYASRNLRKSRQRRKCREQPWGELLDVPDHRHALWSEVSPLVDDELARLPSKYRLPLVLCCVEGMSHQDASKLLNWPIGTVAGRVSRGREMLRKRLLQRGVMVSPTLMMLFLTQDTMAGTIPSLVINSCLRMVFAGSTVGLAGTALSPTVTSVVAGTMKQLMFVRMAQITLVMILLVSVGAGIGLGWYALNGQPVAQAVAVQGQPLAVLPVADQKYVRLPADPNAVVLRCRQTDLLDEKLSWDLTIQADGRVMVDLWQAGSKQATRLEDKLRPQELQQLVQYAVHDEEFPKFQTEKTWNTLLEEYQFEGDMRSPSDTYTTQITLRTLDQEHTVQWYQLSSTEIWFHEVKPVKQLNHLFRRLQNQVVVLQAGGAAAVNVIAVQLNEMLRGTYPKQPPFEAAQLSSIITDGNGAVTQWTFSHGSKFGNPSFFSATCHLAEDGHLKLASVIPGPGDIVPTMKRRIKTN